MRDYILRIRAGGNCDRVAWVKRLEGKIRSMSWRKWKMGDVTEQLANNTERAEDQCSTRRIIKSNCKTEEVEPGKFIRKCQKTEQLLRDCVGRPVEVLQSNSEYTEEDVTNEKGIEHWILEPPSITEPSDSPFSFPGLRNDIEAVERSLFGGISHFFEAAEELKNEFFQSLNTPSDGRESPYRYRVPIDGFYQKKGAPSQKRIDTDFASQVRDV